MGFHRQIQPQPLDCAGIVRLVAEEVAFASRHLDPFALDNACEFSPTGLHSFTSSCGDVACVHCARIAT